MYWPVVDLIMVKLFVFLILVVAGSGARGDESSQLLEKLPRSSIRQKRLLFYDEEGNLVKTYSKPNLLDLKQSSAYFGNFLNPFYSFVRPYGVSSTLYMIPVSDEVVQQINKDPMYQNKFQAIPARDAIVEPNPLCSGKRTQIPSTKSCNYFINCWDGWAYEQECPEGLMFSKFGYCDYAENVDCDNRKQHDKPAPQTPQCTKDFETIRNEQQCSEFFVCVNKSPIRFKCPADLVFSQSLGICDYPSRVSCSSSISVATEAPHSDIPTADTAPSSLPFSGGASIAPENDVKTLVIKNSVLNTQSWSSSHIAMSRQDAIRQLQLGRIANVNTGS